MKIRLDNFRTFWMHLRSYYTLAWSINRREKSSMWPWTCVCRRKHTTLSTHTSYTSSVNTTGDSRLDMVLMYSVVYSRCVTVSIFPTKMSTLVCIYYFTLWAVFMWYTDKCSLNGDHSGQWRSISGWGHSLWHHSG